MKYSYTAIYIFLEITISTVKNSQELLILLDASQKIVGLKL